MTPGLYPLTCTVCGTEFLGVQRRVGTNVFCSKQCGNIGKQAIMRNVGVVPGAFELSELNRETTLRWLACIAADTHQPGETFTAIRTWQGYDAPMPTCDTCSVPFPDLSVSFRIKGSLSGHSEEDAA